MSDRWKVYKCRTGAWQGSWIVRPPGCNFFESFAFTSNTPWLSAWPNALDYAIDQASMEKQPEKPS